MMVRSSPPVLLVWAMLLLILTCLVVVVPLTAERSPDQAHAESTLGATGDGTAVAPHWSDGEAVGAVTTLNVRQEDECVDPLIAC